MQAINEQEEIKRKTEEWTMELVGKVIVSEKIAEQVVSQHFLDESSTKLVPTTTKLQLLV